ncbi:hypothetical protein PMAYCL1PPCAC_23343, partial [Pristionchus mayeri]
LLLLHGLHGSSLQLRPKISQRGQLRRRCSHWLWGLAHRWLSTRLRLMHRRGRGLSLLWLQSSSVWSCSSSALQPGRSRLREGRGSEGTGCHCCCHGRELPVRRGRRREGRVRVRRRRGYCRQRSGRRGLGYGSGWGHRRP